MNKMYRYATGTLLLTSLLAAGCMMEGDDENVELRRSEAEVIIENLIIAGYPAGEIGVTEDGKVFVGGDAIVTLQASREMAGIANDFELFSEDNFRQYRTDNAVDTTRVSVICIDPDNNYAGNASMMQALQTAVDRYNAEGLQFSMQVGGNGCDAHIAAHTDNSGGGVSGFPSNGNPYHELYVDAGLADDYGQAVATHVIMHEIGHTIGFRHSDYYDRSISCGGAKTNEGDGGVGAVHLTGTPSTAVMNGSVMNSCYSLQSNGIWTASDVTALDCFYDTGLCAPPPPPPYSNIQTFANLSAGTSTQTNYGPFDATGLDAIRFQISGGSGDADLYVRFGAPPTTNNFDCRPYQAGNEETCEANPAVAGDYYVMIRAYQAYSGVTLTVDGAGDGGGEPPPPPPPGDSCGDNVCDIGESCDGRNNTTSCPSDCDGVTGGKPGNRYCYVGGACEGPGCP